MSLRSFRLLVLASTLAAAGAVGCGSGSSAACSPTTCAAAGATCGELPDGCGGTLSCGTCGEGQSCASNACASACTPTTCQAAGKNCGTFADGCGGALDCGESCPSGQTCGGAGTPNVCGAGACQPITCQSAGKNCGTIGDGCGHALDCGTCTNGETCGGAGAANVCGKPVCQPTTCAAQKKNCGTIPNGCGGTLECGTCKAGETCGGGGTPNVCGAAACVPTTCAAQKKDCGSISDGCGGTLQCGSCKEGQTCGAGGTPNVCAAPPSHGDVRWSFVHSTVSPDLALDADVDRDGNRYLLGTTVDEVGSASVLWLEKRGRDGKSIWKKTWTFQGFPPWSGSGAFRVAATPLGNVFVAVGAGCPDGPPASCTPARKIDFGNGAIDRSALVKLAPDGSYTWDRPLDANQVVALSTDDQGSALVVGATPTGRPAGVQKYKWDGTLLYSNPAQAVGGALDPAGAALLVTSEAGGALVLRKLGDDGNYAWSLPLDGASWVFRVRTSAQGTAVVLAMRGGDVKFGDSTVTTGSIVLYAAEATGKPRWAIPYEWMFNPALAVDPTGRALVAGQGSSCGDTMLEAVQLDGTSLWRRALPGPDSKACWNTSLGGVAYGADHEPFVGMTFNGTFQAGDAKYTSRGQDAVGVELTP